MHKSRAPGGLGDCILYGGGKYFWVLSLELYVTLLTPTVLRWLLDFLENVFTYINTNISFCTFEKVVEIWVKQLTVFYPNDETLILSQLCYTRRSPLRNF
jgi:hypothetical protein